MRSFWTSEGPTRDFNWCLAAVARGPPDQDAADLPPVTCPVLGVRSDDDHSLTKEQLPGYSEAETGPWRYERLFGASHWLGLDAPTRVIDLLTVCLTDGRQ